MTSESHSIGTQGLPSHVNENGSACGIARWSRIHSPVAMCQLTSPSLKIVCELPSTAGIRSTATSNGRLMRPFCPAAAAVAITRSSSPRPLRSAAAVNGGGDKPDHLRAEEEQLGAGRQTDEQIDTAEDTTEADDPRQRSAEFAFGVRLPAAKHEHRGAHRDERRECSGIC